MALLFGPEKTRRRDKSGLKNFCIPIFLTVEQDEPYKVPVTYFIKRFYENILTVWTILVRRKSQVEAS